MRVKINSVIYKWKIASLINLYLFVMKALYNPDGGIFLIRLTLAVVFMIHGYNKLSALESTVMFFGHLGLPAILAYLIIALEILGGLALLLGVLVNWIGYLLATDMLFAIILVKAKMGLVGGYELELILLLIALGVSLLPPGKFSLFKSANPVNFS